MTIVEKIVDRLIPAAIVFESKDIIAFIDNKPISEGHLLICPKTPYINIYDLPNDLLFDIMSIAKTLTKKMVDNLNIDGVSLMQNNAKLNTLNHFHLHLIPRFKDDKLKFDNIRISELSIDAQEILSKTINK